MPKATIRNIDRGWQIAVNGHRVEDLVTSFILDMSGPNDRPQLMLVLQTDVGLDLLDLEADVLLIDDERNETRTIESEAVADDNHG